MSSNDLVSVYKASTPAEAFLVRNALAAEGIPAQVSEANEPFSGLTIAASDVLVRAADLAQARAIIQQHDLHQADITQLSDEDLRIDRSVVDDEDQTE